MSKATRLGAVLMAAVMVLSLGTPAVMASEPPKISVDQGATDFTVTVTHNASSVNDSEVNVSPDDPNTTYEGDSGVTDENGTVTFALPANETNVTISATFNGSTTSIETTLKAAEAGDGDDSLSEWDGEGPFGQWVSSILKNLMSGNLDEPLGQVLSDLVTKNNPGSDHRSDEANPGGNGNGPPDHAGANDDRKGGPPDHAKGQKDDADDDGEEEESTPTPTPTSED